MLYQWNYHALWQKYQPATAKKYMSLSKSSRPIQYAFNQLGGKFVNSVRQDKRTDWFRDYVYNIPLNKEINDLDALIVTSTDILKDQMLMYSNIIQVSHNLYHYKKLIFSFIRKLVF